MSENPPPSTPRSGRLWIESFVLAAFVLLPWAILEIPRGLGFSDEGGLWFLSYQWAEHGDLPVRDHRFYDPGRYVLMAPFVWMLGEGIVATRVGGFVYAWIGLALALRAITDALGRRWIRAILAVVLSLWLFPLHKLVDHAILLAAIYVLFRAVQRRTVRWSAATGLFVGGATFIGRNHGAYLAAAYLGIEAVLWLRLRRPRGREGARRERSAALPVAGPLRRLAAMGGGLIAGLLPLWGLIIFAPGFAGEYLDFLRQSTVTLGKPVPWPWATAYTRFDWLFSAFNLALGCLFLWLLLFPALAGSRLWRRFEISEPRDLLLLATAALSVGYLPQAFGRPDVSHLAQAVHPSIVGLLPLVVPFPRLRLPGRAVLAAVALSGVVTSAFKRDAVQEWRDPIPWVERTVAGDRLRLPAATAGYLDDVRAVLDRVFPEAEARSGRIYLGPYRAGLYRVFGWDSPCWDSGWPHAIGDRQQRRMIADMERARLRGALVWMEAVDGRTALRFDHTHPLVWEYFQTRFAFEQAADLPGYVVFHRTATDPQP